MRRIFIKKKSVRFYVLLLALSLWILIFILWHKHITLAVVRLQYVVVHIDLKGSPPKLKYLASILPTLKDYGVNGLLIEYEDMFPYNGELVDIRARNCYKQSELRDFLSTASSFGIEIIPLVQTFGHLEYALKLKKFKHLREVSIYPDSICPSQVESRDLVKNMLNQVISFHNSISPLKHIHIGCDEVYHINNCEKCLKKNLTDIDIFLSHVKLITDIVKNESPNTEVLIWDDMLKKINVTKLNYIQIDPVYWDYGKSVAISHVNLFKYHSMFNHIWIASAFKGADGRTATLPNIANRFLNHYSWMSSIANYKFGGEDHVYDFKGIILTGWSRYSNMDPLCELLPASIPSLLLNLLLIKKFKEGNIVSSNYEVFFNESIRTEFNERLQCEQITLKDFDPSSCSFGGNELYNILKDYIGIRNNIETYLNKEPGMSYVEYYSSKKLLNMIHVIYNNQWCNHSINKLLIVEEELSIAMTKYYDDVVIKEYVDYKTYDIKKKLTSLMSIYKSYALNDIWNN